MDKREETVLTGARNAWPSAVSIGDFKLRQVADKLAKRALLVKGKFGGGVPAYQITDKGKAAIATATDDAYEREIEDVSRKLRESMGKKR